jgi:hypothetical protein
LHKVVLGCFLAGIDPTLVVQPETSQLHPERSPFYNGLGVTLRRNKALSQLIKSGGGSGITLDRYNQVQSRMSIARVETLVGEGLEMSRSEADGSLTVNYRWQNADGSAMNAMFQGNKLVTKAQSGLK